MRNGINVRVYILSLVKLQLYINTFILITINVRKKVILTVTNGSKFTGLGQKGDLYPRKITLEPAIR